MEAQVPTSQSVQEALARVLASAGFMGNERRSKFLRFLVEKQLEGDGNELKESVIGVEVFGRDPGYDPKIDGIVRTEAIRLRARLDKYYAAEGSQDPLVIELPKGGYRPLFRARELAAAAPPVATRPPGSTRSWWIGGALAAIAVAAIGGWAMRTTPEPATVAVLPLENLSRNPESEYFSDGLTDEVIRSLSLIEGLTVRARSSSFALKGQRLNAADVGRQLGVDFIVDGSVLHEGERLRVNVELIRASDESRLWSNRFDRTLSDVFAVQDEISRGIANALRVKLGAGRRRYETNLEAYDLYLRGRHEMAGFPVSSRSPGLNAVRYYYQAIDKDASYAIAYAGMADALLAIDGNVVNPEAYRRAKAAAERATALDPMLSEAQSALASIRAREYDWPAAERGYRRAIELNPNNALAHLQLGYSVLILQERFDDGLAEVRRALTLDPLSPYVNTEAGRALLWAGHTGEAIQQLRLASRLDESRGRPYNLLARALTLTGKADEARAVVEEARAQGLGVNEPCAPERWNPSASSNDGTPGGLRREARSLVLSSDGDPYELQKLSDAMRGRSATSRVAQQHACNGDEELAIESLEKALADNEPDLVQIAQSPEWKAIRSNSRFASLRQKMRLP